MVPKFACRHFVPWNLVGECLPHSLLFVLTDCIPFPFPQAEKFIHSVVRPLPTKSFDFAGNPKITPHDEIPRINFRIFSKQFRFAPHFSPIFGGTAIKKGGLSTIKRYNTPHRSRVVKTRLTDEEYANFTERLAPYDISQTKFIRQAITKSTIRPIITFPQSMMSCLPLSES